MKDFCGSRIVKAAVLFGTVPLVLAGCSGGHKAGEMKPTVPSETSSQMAEPPTDDSNASKDLADTQAEQSDTNDDNSGVHYGNDNSPRPSRAGLVAQSMQAAPNPFAPFAKEKPKKVDENKDKGNTEQKPSAPVIDVPSQTVPIVKPKPPVVNPPVNPPVGPNPPVTPPVNPPAPNPDPTTEPTTPSEPVDDYVYVEKTFPGIQAAIEGAKEPGENRNFDSLKNFEKAEPNITDYGQFSWYTGAALGEGKSIRTFSLFPFHRLAFREKTFTPKEIAQYQLMATRAVEVSELPEMKEKIVGLGGEENDFFLWARGDDKRLEVVARMVNQFDIPLTTAQKNILLGKEAPTPEPTPTPSEPTPQP